MDPLRVRAYNVGFGDAILVTVPETGAGGGVVRRHILFDVGNVLAGSGGSEDVFGPVLRDVLAELRGQPLDLYVMTHEHLDHVKGLYHASRQCPPVKIPVLNAWLTASSETGYYDKGRHPEARQRKLEMERSYLQIRRLLAALRAAAAPVPAPVEAMMLNNDRISTRECVKYLASLASQKTEYVHRQKEKPSHPFKEAELTIWAPEEDTSVYYGHFRPLTLGVADPDGPDEAPTLVEPKAPKGVNRASFRRYLAARRRGFFDSLLAIDAAANNTSIVLSLKWHGWHLLFPGDAEIRSWKQMEKAGVLEPVHFLKVSHHGSRNGTPAAKLLDRIFPAEPSDDRPRSALISSHANTYKDVPSAWTEKELATRGATVHSLQAAAPPGGFIDLVFPP